MRSFSADPLMDVLASCHPERQLSSTHFLWRSDRLQFPVPSTLGAEARREPLGVLCAPALLVPSPLGGSSPFAHGSWGQWFPVQQTLPPPAGPRREQPRCAGGACSPRAAECWIPWWTHCPAGSRISATAEPDFTGVEGFSFLLFFFFSPVPFFFLFFPSSFSYFLSFSCLPFFLSTLLQYNMSAIKCTYLKGAVWSQLYISV